MNVRSVVGLLLTLSISSAASAVDKPEEIATERAKSWLILVDQGKYGESWDAAAALFQGAMGRGKWEEALTSVRTPLGGLVSRRVKSAEYRTSLPGVPDGKYVVVQFETTFQNKKGVVEIATSGPLATGRDFL